MKAFTHSDVGNFLHPFSKPQFSRGDTDRTRGHLPVQRGLLQERSSELTALKSFTLGRKPAYPVLQGPHLSSEVHCTEILEKISWNKESEPLLGRQAEM